MCVDDVIKAEILYYLISAREKLTVCDVMNCEFAIYGYKLAIHFHIWLLVICDVTDRLLFEFGY